MFLPVELRVCYLELVKAFATMDTEGKASLRFMVETVY